MYHKYVNEEKKVTQLKVFVAIAHYFLKKNINGNLYS